MAIGPWYMCCRGKIRAVFALLAFFSFSLSLHAQDKIIFTDPAKSPLFGAITGVSDGRISIDTKDSSGNTAKLTIYISDIQSVVMPPPPEVAKVKNAPPATAIPVLEPIVKQWAGLPADWTTDAMSQLADAYDAQNQSDKSAAIYAEFGKLYANVPAGQESIVGQAKMDLKSGNYAAALAAVQSLVTQANANIAPSAPEGRLFAGAFLVYGQCLEHSGQFPQALEAYLTVKTMFYQNPALADQADQLAKALLAHHQDVAVD